VGEGPYLGPTEYFAGVQETVAAIGSVDAAVISLDGTVVASTAAVVAAVGASATAITTALTVEINGLRAQLSSWRTREWPVGTVLTFQCQALALFNGQLALTRTSLATGVSWRGELFNTSEEFSTGFAYHVSYVNSSGGTTITQCVLLPSDAHNYGVQLFLLNGPISVDGVTAHLLGGYPKC